MRLWGKIHGFNNGLMWRVEGSSIDVICKIWWSVKEPNEEGRHILKDKKLG